MPQCTVAVALTVIFAGSASAVELTAEDGLVCGPLEAELDKYAYLRSVSLDLRGTIPTVEEYTALEAVDDVEEATLDAWLDTDAFATQVVMRHRALFWNNIGNVNLVRFQQKLSNSNGIWWRPGKANAYRGRRVRCANEPATIDDGVIQTRELNGARVEGWVEVNPYWDPAATIRVCAFDAQETLLSPDGAACSEAASIGDVGCGCGPQLRYCLTNAIESDIKQFLAEDLDLRVAQLIRDDLPYTDLFTNRTGYINGPLLHYLRYLASFPANVDVRPVPYALEQIADIPFIDDAMRPVALGPMHAGVLTSPAFLLRFQTNRARASRFYDAFMCQPFQAPAGALPSPDDPCSQDPDLQTRCGCKYCHSLLEPAAAHWGRWRQAGAGYLDPGSYPRSRADCTACARTGQACSTDCRRNYVTRIFDPVEEPYLGLLNAYYFRSLEHEVVIDQGPALLAATAVVDNRLPACVARRVAQWLLGRALYDEEAELADALTKAFIRSGYSYRELVKAVVSSAEYRRVR